MRRVKKSLFHLTILSVTILPACSTLTLTSVRDAASSGTADFVETAVFDFLTSILGTTGTIATDAA